MSQGRYAHRRRAQFPVRLNFREAAQAPSKSGFSAGLTLVGRTRDISESGVGLIVSASKIKHYLARKDCRIDLAIELPGGVVRAESTLARFQSLEEGGVVKGYFIGAHFTKITNEDRERITQFAAPNEAE
ncbi:MAG TPA: PilZ domain-containing protein [Pyrinomonadaceae bacterium]|nr:PilZ domain-containing protein [Pyrinomonadaceae bacterium]